MHDFTAITETPGSHLNAEQLTRITQRYHLGATLAQGKDVLEVACGAGIGLGVLQGAAHSLVGCDYTLPVLTIAQSHYTKRVPLLCADAQALPFATASFDLVLAFEVIYYLKRPECFLGEANRLLRKDGTLLIGTSNPDWPHFAAGQMSVHYPNLPELATFLAHAGFHSTQFYGALPVATSASRGKRVLATLRKRALHYKIFTADSRLTRSLKQLAYGRLTPLPAELTVPHGSSINPYDGLMLISPHVPDRIHRVLFAVAHKE